MLPPNVEEGLAFSIIHQTKMADDRRSDDRDVIKTECRNWRQVLLKHSQDEMHREKAVGSSFNRRMIKNPEDHGKLQTSSHDVNENNHFLFPSETNHRQEQVKSSDDTLQSSFGYDSSFRRDLKSVFHLLREKQEEEEEKGLMNKIKKNLFDIGKANRQPQLSFYCRCIKRLVNTPSDIEPSCHLSSNHQMASFLDVPGKIFTKLFGCDFPEPDT